MDKIKVTLKEALLRIDSKGFVLDVSNKAFEANPKKVYEVPATKFWYDLVYDATERKNGLLIRYEGKAKAEPEKGEPNEKTD